MNPESEEDKVLEVFGITVDDKKLTKKVKEIDPPEEELDEQIEEDSPAKKDTALSVFGGQAQMVIKDLPPLGEASEPMPVGDFLKTLKDGPTEAPAIEKEDAIEDTVFAGPALPKHEPFADIKDPDILFLINEWGVTENERIIIRTHVESFTIRNVIKRADYNDQIEYEEIFRPVNLPCNFIVDHVPEKIAETNSDIRLVSEVVRRASREMDLTIMAVIQDRLDDRQRDIREKASRIKEGGTPIGKPAAPAQEEL